MGRFTGKVILVTGGGSGIGRGTALRFAAEGAAVVVADITEDGTAATVGQIESGGGRAVATRTDVRSLGDCIEAVGKAESEFGRLDSRCGHRRVG